MFIRPGTQDVGAVINNCIREEYGRFRPAPDPRWMIDGGAYIGDTAAYFLSRFPNLTVVALEPNSDSYEMAVRNLEPYGGRAIVLKCGLWAADKCLHFDGTYTSASIREEGQEIDCFSVESIMQRYSIRQLDILKMDIEGAEEAVLSAHPGKWLSKTRLLMVEFHGRNIREKACRVLSANGFTMRQHRSIFYCSPAS
jgi:FkbM family methyltransferase